MSKNKNKSPLRTLDNLESEIEEKLGEQDILAALFSYLSVENDKSLILDYIQTLRRYISYKIKFKKNAEFYCDWRFSILKELKAKKLELRVKMVEAGISFKKYHNDSYTRN